MSSRAPLDTPLPPLPHLSLQAFCLSDDVAVTLDAAKQDRRMVRVHYAQLGGGAPAALSTYQTAPTPNVLLVETLSDREQVLHELDSLAEVCDPGTKVVVVGHTNDVVLYRELIRRGVSDYLVYPFEPMEFVQVLGDLYQGERTAPLGRVVAFFGVRGGVGASTVAHNVAVAATQVLDRDSVIIDLDLAFGTAGLDFNLDPTQGMADVLLTNSQVDAVFLDRLMANASERVKLLGAPAMADDVYDLPEAAAAETFDVLRRMVPLTVVDMPHQWTSFTRRVLNDADDVVLVASPDLASLRNAKTMVDALARLRLNDDRPFVVLSQVGMPKRPEIKDEDFKRALGFDLAARIPFDPAMFGEAANEGRPLVELFPKSAQAATFTALAGMIGRRDHLAGSKGQSSNSLFVNMFNKLKIARKGHA